MSLTKRQACFLILVCLVSNKLQRLPNFIATNVHRNGYFVFLILGTIDILMMCLILITNKRSKHRDVYQICQRAGGNVFAKIIMFMLSIFFFISALIPYESIHDLFAYVLFDHLSWEVYSILLISAIFFLASKGIKNIGRTTELFFYFMFISLLGLLVLGVTTTHFERILPIYNINFSKILKTCFDYSIWFGDFFIVYMFIGKIKEDDGKIGWQFILVQCIGVLIVTFAYIVFYGIYENLAPNQGSLISSISQFSLLNLDIGRVDLLLVLAFEFSTFIASAVFVYSASHCLSKIFEVKNKIFTLIPLIITMYVLDITLFKSVQVGAGVLSFVTRYFYPVIILFVPISVLLATYRANSKDKKQRFVNNVQPLEYLTKKSSRQYQKSKKKNKSIPSKKRRAYNE